MNPSNNLDSYASHPHRRLSLTHSEPVAELQQQFSSTGASPTSWAEARTYLAKAEIFWLSTVRPDGRPHVTPLVAVWLDDALYFSAGGDERKSKNLRRNAHCILTTGCNTMGGALDLVVEGDALRVTEPDRLQRVAAAFGTKYQPPFQFVASGDGFIGAEGSAAHVYELKPSKGFAYGRGEHFSATRWRF